MTPNPEIIAGGKYIDGRGTLCFINDFTFEGIKRFYTIEQTDTSVVRAWQGHRIEQKWFFVTRGSFLVRLIRIDDWINPSDQLQPEEYILVADKTEILYIPPGFANGFKALQENSMLLVFSDLTTEESTADNQVFDKTKWGNWNESFQFKQ